MSYKAIARVIGLLLMIFSSSMLFPIFVGLFYNDGGIFPFEVGFLFTLLAGGLLWLPYHDTTQELKTADGISVVVLFWGLLSLFGAIPLAIVEHTHPITDAIFETVSGLTTTGAEIFSKLDSLPHAVLYYHQQLQLFGGMGVIVLAVAILPMLGIGGAQLYRVETSYSIHDTKLTPRLKETAKQLWIIYVFLTALCALSYWAAGMSLFDAIGESFATVSTGGLTLHDASFYYYHSVLIDLIAIVFMILGSINFSLHVLAFHQRRIKHYWRDTELRTFLAILGFVSLVVAITLSLYRHGKDFWHNLLNGTFDVVSTATTTGFVTTHFHLWPTFIPYFILLTALMGGCTSSTSGGIKVARLLLMIQQSRRELQRLLHPNIVTTIKFGERTVDDDALQSMWGFLAIFALLFIMLLLLLLATGLDFNSAASSLMGCISNTGIALGQGARGFSHFSLAGKWILIVAMLAGRLEIFTLVVLFMPSFWRE